VNLPDCLLCGGIGHVYEKAAISQCPRCTSGRDSDLDALYADLRRLGDPATRSAAFAAILNALPPLIEELRVRRFNEARSSWLFRREMHEDDRDLDAVAAEWSRAHGLVAEALCARRHLAPLLEEVRSLRSRRRASPAPARGLTRVQVLDALIDDLRWRRRAGRQT
jgi:hypothetical protein